MCNGQKVNSFNFLKKLKKKWKEGKGREENFIIYLISVFSNAEEIKITPSTQQSDLYIL